ncbi:hypothetical protein Ancab_018855 [Ancistrocladus abbreviatus]
MKAMEDYFMITMVDETYGPKVHKNPMINNELFSGRYTFPSKNVIDDQEDISHVSNLVDAQPQAFAMESLLAAASEANGKDYELRKKSGPRLKNKGKAIVLIELTMISHSNGSLNPLNNSKVCGVVPKTSDNPIESLSITREIRRMGEVNKEGLMRKRIHRVDTD